MNGLIDQLSLFWPALLTAMTLAVAGGIGGVLVVLRRQTLLVLSLPQIVTLGAAIGLRMGWPTLPPAIAVVAAAVLLIAWSSTRKASHLILPALFVAGMCLSILVVAGAGAELIQVQNMFVGIDVAVEPNQAIIAGIVLTGIACAIAILWRRWILLAQAPATAELANLRPTRWDLLFLCLISSILLIGTDVMGTALAVVMLFLPAATVLPWAKRVPTALLLAGIAGLLFVLLGFVLSIGMDWPLSQSIGGTGCAAFLLSHLLAR
ncbi:MAG TPA: metal ABC transporter permease [Tepidisphaeraceae bacterium]|nr:metal ABC transporter permease [Tepidisphaeraceae bacterium]